MEAKARMALMGIRTRSIDETHEDGSSDRANVGSPDLLLVKVETLLYLGQKRSDGEPDEERSEEAEPRAVEGTHVWAGEVAKLDFCGFIILVGVDFECVGLILLDVGLAGLNFGHDECSGGGRELSSRSGRVEQDDAFELYSNL